MIPTTVEIEKDAFKLEAERRLREISKHRDLVDEEGQELHANLNRCLEELRAGFQAKVPNRRSNFARRVASEQMIRRKLFDELRDLYRVEDQGHGRVLPHPKHRRFVSS